MTSPSVKQRWTKLQMTSDDKRLVALSLLLAACVPALLGNFGSSGSPGVVGTTNGVWLTNNDYFNVVQRYLQPATASSTNWAVLSYNSIPGWTGNTWASSSACSEAGHDTCVYDATYGNNNLLGWNQCAGSTSGSHPDQECGMQYSKINLTYSSASTGDYIRGSDTVYNLCHEIGHSVGLRHTSNQASCLKTAANGGASSYMSSHDTDHLQNEY